VPDNFYLCAASRRSTTSGDTATTLIRVCPIPAELDAWNHRRHCGKGSSNPACSPVADNRTGRPSPLVQGQFSPTPRDFGHTLQPSRIAGESACIHSAYMHCNQLITGWRILETLMNESMPGKPDAPDNFTSSISRVAATAAREYVEHPYWFALAIILTAALLLLHWVNSSDDTPPPGAPPSQSQPEAVTRSIDPLKPPLQSSAEPPSPSLAPSIEPQNPTHTSSTEPQIQSVKFPNPFDPDEVFEFAPGTSKEDARAAVVEILKERALRRQAL
jgi:hypothetical protein